VASHSHARKICAVLLAERPVLERIRRQQRALIIELVAYLRQRQAATAGMVQDREQFSNRFEARERERQARLTERLDGVDTRLATLGAQLAELREVTRSLFAQTSIGETNPSSTANRASRSDASASAKQPSDLNGTTVSQNGHASAEGTAQPRSVQQQPTSTQKDRPIGAETDLPIVTATAQLAGTAAERQSSAHTVHPTRTELAEPTRAPIERHAGTAKDWPIGAETGPPIVIRRPSGSPSEPPQAKELLRVEGLAKEIGGTDILQDICFSIYEGEILGLIGPNGAGKTTLMECLAGMRPRSGGAFYLDGEAPASWEPKELLFYLPNNVLPYSELFTIEVLTFFGQLHEVDHARWDQIVMRDLSLGPVLGKRVSALSKGNMQRLLIALALMSPQPLLALDEPFDGLDLHQTQAMMGTLRGLRSQSRTLLLCIHQLNDAERICDRVLLLSGGKLVGVGTLAELRQQTGLAEGSLEQIFLALT
jgi:ABC-2 type transport system ATP-binding protein